MTTSLSPGGLHKLHELMAAHVESGQVPGLITLVAIGDDVHVDVLGTTALDETAPLQRDAIFRIASLSKPITAAATMALVDDGTLQLDRPVDDLLPELANRRVLRAVDAELDDTVPATRSITVEDLLSFRMGIGIVVAMPMSTPIQRAEAALDLKSMGGPPWPPTSMNVDEWMAGLGSLPLVHQPGEVWMYNTGSQVLGVLLARATGKDLQTVLRERVFEPVGMPDTGFTVPADQVHRLPTYYSPDPETGEMSVIETRADSWWAQRPSFPDASGMLVSTIDDYWAFVSMLLAGGMSSGGRVLSEQSVQLMTTDRLTAPQRDAAAVPFLEGGGWGLGMAAPAADQAGLPLPVGFGWNGGSGTVWRTNPENGVTGILLTQRAMTSPEPPAVFQDFWSGVNAAIA